LLDYKKILFPVDLSETSVKIFPHVETIVDKFGAEVWLMFVAKVNDYFVEGEEPGASIKKKVTEYKNEYFSGIPDSHVVVTEGEPAEEILSYITAEDIDLVIMATRGRTALDKAIFGSVASKVARVGLVPVVLVNPYSGK
jgi:nucleotide-binding universal stress UspA family protein